jgi:hypothetical protein
MLAVGGEHLGITPVAGESGADDRADAGASDPVKGVAGLAQRTYRTEVREAARAAAGQHQTGGVPT